MITKLKGNINQTFKGDKGSVICFPHGREEYLKLEWGKKREEITIAKCIQANLNVLLSCDKYSVGRTNLTYKKAQSHAQAQSSTPGASKSATV